MTVSANMNLVARNFAVQAQPFAGLPIAAELVDFTPKSEEASAWAVERSFYLFGGSGNIDNSQETVPPETHATFISQTQARLDRALDEVRADPEETIRRTEESFRLMAGFLEFLQKPSLKFYQTSSLYGEQAAYRMKAHLLGGEDMVQRTARCLCDPGSHVWVAPQITPYVPYVAVLFLRPEVVRRHWLTAHYADREYVVEPLPQGAEQLMALAKQLRCEAHDRTRQDRRNAEVLVTNLWNALHTQALARLYGGATVYARWMDSNREAPYERPNESEIGALALQWKEKRVLRFPGIKGFALSNGEPLLDITDFALISTRRMFEEGAFRFLVLKHEPAI